MRTSLVTHGETVALTIHGAPHGQIRVSKASLSRSSVKVCAQGQLKAEPMLHCMLVNGQRCHNFTEKYLIRSKCYTSARSKLLQVAESLESGIDAANTSMDTLTSNVMALCTALHTSGRGINRAPRRDVSDE